MTDVIQRRRFLSLALASVGVAMGERTSAGGESAPGGAQLRRTPNGDLLETVPKGGIPSFAQRAGPQVQETYRYAAGNGETLRYIPCFCGCQNVGHRSNEDCYVTERHPDGRITFNSHSAG